MACSVGVRVRAACYLGMDNPTSRIASHAVYFAILLSIYVGGASGECNALQWQCDNAVECVALTDICDGRSHCTDGSDETFSTCGNVTCPGYAFQCSYGACVDGDATCNGVADCADRSDELLPSCPGIQTTPDVNNCKEREFACLDGAQCIPLEELCNGVVNCPDKSDETVTQCVSFTCPGYAFRCAYGACVDGDAACNKENECADGSDEYAPQCNVSAPSFINNPNAPTELIPHSGGSRCLLPKQPNHGQYFSYECESDSTSLNCPLKEGNLVPQGFYLNYECYDGFSRRGNDLQACRRGGWYPPTQPYCSEECLPLPRSRRMDVLCFRSDDTPIPCTKNMPPLSYARFSCRTGLYELVRGPGYDRIYCRNGEWTKPLPDDDICQPSCGRAVLVFADPFVVNGTKAQYGSFPWHVGIYEYKPKPKLYGFICGGSLVSHEVVITAAHCFKEELKNYTVVDRNPANMRIGLGKQHRKLYSEKDTQRQVMEIKQVILSPDYVGQQSNYADDIAIVILKKSVEFTPAVLPVCLDLGRDSTEDDQLIQGAVGMVAGWGLTEDHKLSEELLVANMPFVSRDVCLQTSSLQTFITKDKICAGDPSTRTSVCSGDSGGGYVFQDRDTRKYKLRGVVSVGERECSGNDYALFTKISKHANFINKYI